MQYVKSIGKKNSNSGKRRRYQQQKKHWVLYGYDENGVFRTERVKWYTAYWFRLSKKKVNVKYDK